MSLLEEFKYVIVHRFGKSMMHIDALSRRFPKAC